MFSWPHRVYYHPRLQAAYISKCVQLYVQQDTQNVISGFGTDQQMQPDGFFLSQDGIESFPIKDLTAGTDWFAGVAKLTLHWAGICPGVALLLYPF